MSRRRVQRSGRRASAASGVLPDDLYEYYAAQPGQRCSLTPTTAIKTLRVADDWPERIPVTEAELDVFERYFGDILDRLFDHLGPDRENEGLRQLTSDVNRTP